MQRTHECIREVFNVGQLFVAVVDQQGAGEHPQHQQAEIRRNRTGENETDHGLTDVASGKYKKFHEACFTSA